MQTQGLHHIAIISSAESSIDFYKAMGFTVDSYEKRPNQHDALIFMSGFGVTLEIIIDSAHPQRISSPEAFGLRHIAFCVKDFDGFISVMTAAGYNCTEIRHDKTTGVRFTFYIDPDGLPIEIRE